MTAIFNSFGVFVAFGSDGISVGAFLIAFSTAASKLGTLLFFVLC